MKDNICKHCGSTIGFNYHGFIISCECEQHHEESPEVTDMQDIKTAVEVCDDY